MKALFHALSKTYGYLTPDLWRETVYVKSPYQEWSDYLAQTTKDNIVPKEVAA